MKTIPFFITIAVLTAFGLLTTFLTTSIILDLFDIRAREGNYVPLVVWANLVSGILFLTTAYAFYKKKSWAPLPMMISLGVLVLAFVGLFVHINSGGAYETKTIGAMIFRIAMNSILGLIVYSATKKYGVPTLKNSLLMLLPLAFFIAGCGHSHDEKAHDHHDAQAEEAHHDHGATAEAIQLNNGEKWEADEHTRSVAERMKTEVSNFEVGKDDHKVLADSLTNQLNVLVAGCTMKGPAHDELHKWLVPYTENVKDLSSTQDAGEASEIVGKIEESLNSFGEYFK